MIRTSRMATILAGTALAATTLLGCSAESVDDASSAYCEAVENLRSELQSLRSLVTSDATVDQIAEQREAVRAAFEQTESAADTLDEAVRAAAGEANSAFDAAVGDIPTDVPISEAAAGYTEASEAYLDQLVSIGTDAGCS